MKLLIWLQRSPYRCEEVERCWKAEHKQCCFDFQNNKVDSKYVRPSSRQVKPFNSTSHQVERLNFTHSRVQLDDLRFKILLMSPVLLSEGFCNSILRTGWLKTTEIHSLISGGLKTKIKVSTGPHSL